MISKRFQLMRLKTIFLISTLAVYSAQATLEVNAKDSDYLLPAQQQLANTNGIDLSESHMRQSEGNTHIFVNGKWLDSTKKKWLTTLDKYYSQYNGGENNIPVSTTNMHKFNRNNDHCGQVPSLCNYKFVAPLSPIYNSYSRTSTVTIPHTFTTNVTIHDVHTVPINLNKVSNTVSHPNLKLDLATYNKEIFGIGGSNPLKALDIKAVGDTALDAKVMDLCKKAKITCDKETVDKILSHNCGWKKTNKEEKVQTQEVVIVKNKTKLITKIEPMIYANLDFSEKITSMTVFDPYVGGGANNPPVAGDLVRLQPAKKDDGYSITKGRMFGVGGGPSIQTMVQWSGNPILAILGRVGGFAGVMGTISRSDLTTRHVKNIKDADENKHIYREKSVDDIINNIINRWNIDDSYSYQYSGGYVLSAGLSWFAIAMGPTFFSENGKDNKTITKIGPKQVMVEIKDLDLKSFALTAGLGIVSASRLSNNENVPLIGKFLNTITEQDRSTYLFDFEYPEGRETFKKLMSGVVIDAQYRAAKGASPAVARVDHERMRTYLAPDETMSSFFFGIPYIFSNKLAGDQSQDGNTDYFVDGKHADFNQGINMDRYDRRIIFDHKMKLRGFYGGAQRVSDSNSDPKSDKGVDQYYYGRYTWVYQDESADKEDLVEQLAQLTHVETGLEELNADASNIKNKIGYLNIELNLDISKQATEVLYDRLLDPQNKALETAVVAEIEKYFRSYGNGRKGMPTGIKKADYCHVHDGFTPNGDKEAVAMTDWTASIQGCRKFAYNESLYSGVVGRMIKQLEEIKKLSIDVKSKEGRFRLSHAYREFGKLMMTNRFTFKAIYNILKEGEIGDFVTLKIQGQEIANMVRHMPSDVYEVKPDISMK